MKSKIPKNFCYAVFCNPHPSLLYGIYKSKQEAVRYALNLIRWRRKGAAERGYEFGYYHFNPFVYRTIEQEKKSEFYRDNLWRESCVFSACLKIKDNEDKKSPFSDDGCNVRVLRYPLI
jgi:hypothetical protein